jgi:hypothetical protein
MVGYRNSKCTQLEEHQHQKGPSVVVFGFVFSSTSFNVSVACGGLPSESSNDFRRIHRYNSAFFSSLATNDYNIVYATENFVTGAPFDAEAIGATWLPPGYDVTPVQEQIASYERLENAACIEAYAKDFITDRRTLVIIASNSSTDGGSLLGSDSYELSSPGTGWAPYDWFVRFCYPDLGLISHSH